MKYEFSVQVSPQEIAELRKSVGWNSMEEYYNDSLKQFGINIVLHVTQPGNLSL